MKPLVYKTTDEDLYAGKHGGILTKYNEFVKGFDQLIEDMNWHLNNQLFDYPKEIYDANGEIELKVY